jgi:hypothetical protein
MYQSSACITAPQRSLRRKNILYCPRPTDLVLCKPSASVTTSDQLRLIPSEVVSKCLLRRKQEPSSYPTGMFTNLVCLSRLARSINLTVLVSVALDLIRSHALGTLSQVPTLAMTIDHSVAWASCMCTFCFACNTPNWLFFRGVAGWFQRAISISTCLCATVNKPTHHVTHVKTT